MGRLSDYLGEEGFTQPEDDGGDDFSFVPTGWYPAEIQEVDIRDNKPKIEGGTSTGSRFVVKFCIIGESYANRKIWNGNGFNFINDSQDCQNIGRRELGRLVKACGFAENDRLRDEDELIGKKLDIYVETVPGTEGYKDTNPATKFKPLGTGGDKAAPAAPVATKPVVPAAQEYQKQVGAQNEAAPAAAQNEAAPAPAQAPAAPVGKMPWE